MRAVVMAGGIGKRMRQKGEKPMINLCGKPLLMWVIDALKKSTKVSEIMVAASCFTRRTYRWALHNNLEAFYTSGLGYERDLVEVSCHAPCLVIASDLPLIKPETIDKIIMQAKKTQVKVLTIVVPLKEFRKFSSPNSIKPINKKHQPTGISIINSPLNKGTEDSFAFLEVKGTIEFLNVNTMEELKRAKEVLCKK